MTSNQQSATQRDQNQSANETPSYVGSTPTSTVSKPIEKQLTEKQPTEKQPTEKQPEVQPKTNNSNPALTRALVGGLIGATLGSLAGALAGKRTSTGFNHAAQGMGNAFKRVGSGLNQAGKGLGDAAKSVGEGVNYVVVGGTIDAAKEITDGAMQVGVATADAVQTTVSKVNEAVQDTADSVKAASELTTQSIAGVAETGREMASDADATLDKELSQVEAEAEAAQISNQENPFPSVEGNQSRQY
ncbi:MAG: hypothetical protein Kow00121_01540 [Elainellaceae cyanobacterium]